MLVKHNLYINPRFKEIAGQPDIKDGLLVASNLDGSATGFLHEEYNLTLGQNYYVGFVGKVSGNLRLFKGTYVNITSKGDMHYIEFIYSENTKPIHMWGYGTDLVIEKFFITDEIPDIVIPNIEDHIEKAQIYPPEGNYKEIQAL